MKKIILLIIASLTLTQFAQAVQLSQKNKLIQSKYKNSNPTPMPPTSFEKAKVVIYKWAYEKVNDKMEWKDSVTETRSVEIPVFDLIGKPNNEPDTRNTIMKFSDTVDNQYISIELFFEITKETTDSSGEKFGIPAGTNLKNYAYSLAVSRNSNDGYDFNGIQETQIGMFSTKDLNLKSVLQSIAPRMYFPSTSCSIDAGGKEVCIIPPSPAIKSYYTALVIIGE